MESFQIGRRRNRSVVIAGLPALAIYFGLVLLQNGVPAVGGNMLFFAYVLSIPFVLMALVALGVWGGVGLLRAHFGKARPKHLHRVYVLVACISIVLSVIAFGLARSLPRALPSGSYLRAFDSNTWKAPGSDHHVAGDITPRQKMLGDVVRNILPGRTRAELEELLGPSVQTAYFRSTGRDLIYPLGFQRDAVFSIDSEWLLIWLDDRGRFRRYEVLDD